MSMTCDPNSRNDSPDNFEMHHSAADTLEQTPGKLGDICSTNLQNALISKENWDVQSESSTGTINNQQLDTNADLVNFLPTDTICGQIEINDSSGNHIGTKIVASTLTVINNNNSTATNTPLKKNESTIQTTSILTTTRCNKLIVFSSIIMIVLTILKFYDFNTSGGKKRQSLSSNTVTDLPVLITTVEPKLPDPWIVSRAQWGAITPQTTCRGYYPAIGVAIGDTKTNTCKSIPACSKIIREIQSNTMMSLKNSNCDIDYNFLIGYDSRIYEGLAWNGTKLFDFHIIVKIAFIGDYSSTGRNDTLTDTQVFSLLKFLEKSENEQRFERVYTITTECCSDNVRSPGDNILLSMISWNTNKLAFSCIFNDVHRTCRHLHFYYSKYHLDKYKHGSNY